MVNCVKLGREAEGLDFPPDPGELGNRIYENVSKEAWAQWLKQQTMLLNENRQTLAAFLLPLTGRREEEAGRRWHRSPRVDRINSIFRIRKDPYSIL